MACDPAYYGTGWGDLPYGSPEDTAVLGIERVVAVRENQVEVTFSQPVYYTNLLDEKDAAEVSNWTVTPITSIGYNGQQARTVSPIRVDKLSSTQLLVWLDRSMTPYPAQYQLTVQNIWTVDKTTPIDECFVSYGFYGLFKFLQANLQDQMVPQRDFASPQTLSAFADPLPFIDPSLLGVFNVDDTGDYAFDEGVTAFQKRITRRLVSKKNSFQHLPGYGIGIQQYVKKLSRAVDRKQFATDVENQLAKEPEVRKVGVTFTPYTTAPNLVKLTIKIKTTLGFAFTVEHGFEVGLPDGSTKPT